MPDFSALKTPPKFTVTISDDSATATITYEGYFTDGTSVRFGRGVVTLNPIADFTAANITLAQNTALYDAFPALEP